MAEGSSTPLFTVGQETAAFLASCEILSKAWEESHLASNSESFSLKEHEGVVYVAFPSFHRIESFIVKVSKYGEGNIQTNNRVFSDCLKGNDDKPALVHQGALKLFLHIMEKTGFQAKIYTDSRQRKLKPIIFVGHSLGGAVATLATLWVLEKRVRQSSPFCITFGCPLVGDERLVEAVGRENWGGNFFHVISQHDIVPRMLLAPIESIAEPLTAILPYWHDKVADSSIQDACRTLLENVLQYTYTVAYYGVDSRGSDGVIKRSPYKPLGTYMFCSSHGAACIDNSETILKLLHFTMQSHEKLSDNIVQDWFSEHIGYGAVLKHVIENSISGKRFANPDSKSSYEMGISLQLEAIGVGAQNDHAQFALRRAGETEDNYNTNVDKLAIELSLKQSSMAELEWYKERCEKEDGITYYDSFKKQNNRKDFRANVDRKKLCQFWDEIIEKWEGHELPSDFESQNKWINAGNTYRRLVEPLDIASYYRTNGNGNYLSDGRPNRHKILQRWMEAKEKTRSSRGQRPRTKRASLTADSCFWAHVEEAWKDLENLKQGQHQSLQKLEKFEEDVTNMENALTISPDVFLEGSSFIMWWEEWKEYKKNQSPEWSSPLYKIMEKLQVI
uniref:Fungal lipase-like domain-containing protein n=1 Tax=Picea sitchensis TaxID=3332 RepID=A9NW04_PICSI|nr:unknown [Picea sitchensis]